MGFQEQERDGVLQGERRTTCTLAISIHINSVVAMHTADSRIELSFGLAFRGSFPGSTPRIRNIRHYICSIDERFSSEFDCPESTPADEVRDRLPRDAPQSGSLRCRNPVLGALRRETC
jgi:hypothetical protein